MPRFRLAKRLRKKTSAKNCTFKPCDFTTGAGTSTPKGDSTQHENGDGSYADGVSPSAVSMAAGISCVSLAVHLAAHSKKTVGATSLGVDAVPVPPPPAPFGSKRCKYTPTAPPRQCRADMHICREDKYRGCSACGMTCHKSCDDELCAKTPCSKCHEYGVITPFESSLCIDLQSDDKVGCHACGQHGCISTKSTCLKSGVRSHFGDALGSTGNPAVCAPVVSSTCTFPCRLLSCAANPPGTGCRACDKTCHTSSADRRCPLYGRQRGVLDWDAGDNNIDSQEGTGGSVPHFLQINWRPAGKTPTGADIVVVDDKYYYRGKAPVLGNNCLIHSLSQCLRIFMYKPDDVRNDLLQEFGHVKGSAQVTPDNFLDLESHWASIIRSLARHNQCGSVRNFDVSKIRIVCFSQPSFADSPAILGSVLGNTAEYKRTLVVMNSRNEHFDPCLPWHGNAED